jgi:hypothetical protein
MWSNFAVCTFIVVPWESIHWAEWYWYNWIFWSLFRDKQKVAHLDVVEGRDTKVIGLTSLFMATLSSKFSKWASIFWDFNPLSFFIFHIIEPLELNLFTSNFYTARLALNRHFGGSSNSWVSSTNLLYLQVYIRISSEELQIRFNRCPNT